jgi:alkanesulfonate monooxygenase SsuD/methylene tetrahydromethanopterin reductase-like flavin-dependent oxidoreductase (luciferase family)
MRYAVSLPNFGQDLSARRVADLARAAEEAGWDGFFLWDHLLAFTPGPAPLVDPWIALTAAALATSQIRLGPMVTPLPRRRPVTLARQTVTFDHLSGGRLILGVGIGAEPFEWDYLGEEPDPKIRGAMLDEALAVLTGLWTGQPFAYEGRHYRIGGAPPNADWRALFAPPPVQQPRIPVWVAGVWPRKPPFRRAARWDGVFPIRANEWMTPDDVREMLAYMTPFRTGDAPFDVVVAGETPGDDPAAGVATVAAFAAAGATWWIEDLSFWRFPTSEESEARIRQGPPRT